MAKIRAMDTKPEMIVRRLVYSLGYRYRLHVKHLPGKPDLTFKRTKRVIFVHGCFWHRHGLKTCRGARIPKSNTSYWQGKIEQNAARDQRNISELLREDWSVLIVWECQTRDKELLKREISTFLT